MQEIVLATKTCCKVFGIDTRLDFQQPRHLSHEGIDNKSQGSHENGKEYYVTISEFYLQQCVSDYLDDSPNSVVVGSQYWTDENGDKYKIFHGYQYAEYSSLMAHIGELSDDALRVFQKEICRRGIFPYFDRDRCITIAPRIVCCSVEDKPQWNGDNSITFPYKQVVKHQQENEVRYDPTKSPRIAVWLREYRQQSLEEQLDLDQKLMYGNTLLHRPDITPQDAVETFIREILKTCLNVASEIRKSESKLKRETTCILSENAPQEQKTKRFGRKKKQQEPLGDVIKKIPYPPNDEQENEHWVSAQTAADITGVSIKSLNSMRNNPNADKNGLWGRDSSGRIFWKPEESSKKTFYYVKNLKVKQLPYR